MGVRTEAADLAMLRAAQSVANGVLDALANAHTLVGHAATTTGVAGALAYRAWRRGEGVAALAPLLIVLTAVVELALKLTTGHAPPGPELSRSWLDTGGVPTPSGFPSGHAARLAFLSLYLGALTRGA
ncbi:MAG TPA: hypothetical protein VFM93_04245, partial [Candidatus Limnocylindria bacterium]|nr:hypothetical protein [Candidatus Limnocylindria bacterium]